MRKMTKLLRKILRIPTRRSKEPFVIYDIRSELKLRDYEYKLVSFMTELSKKFGIMLYYIDIIPYDEGIGIKIGVCGHDHYGKLFIKYSVKYPKDYDIYNEKELDKINILNGYIDYTEIDLKYDNSYASYVYAPKDKNELVVESLPLSEDCGMMLTCFIPVSRVSYLLRNGVTDNEIYEYIKKYIIGWFTYQ